MAWIRKNKNDPDAQEKHVKMFISADSSGPEEPANLDNPSVGKLQVDLVHGEGDGEEAAGDEDLEDPQATLKRTCAATKECAELLGLLEECNERVSGKEETRETCAQELNDFVECVDHCVSKKLFSLLK